MLKKVLESVSKKGYYQTCFDYLLKTGMNEFTASMLITGLLNSKTNNSNIENTIKRGELPAIIEIHQALIRSGYEEEDADALAARFMEEEAFDYVKFVNNNVLVEDESHIIN